MTQSEKILLEFLQIRCLGKQNALTGLQLAQTFGCTKRVIQRQIQAIRQETIPILSTDHMPDKGYYYPDIANQDEIVEAKLTLVSMERRAAKTFQTARNIRRGLNKLSREQLKLELKEVSGL
jgi:biotin operon repressor